MSGGSRGIGLAIALRAARDGANVALLAKTDTPHPKLEGTVHSAAEQIRAAGGNALPIVGDVRNDDDVTEAVLKTQGEFGGIDIVDQQRERHRPVAARSTCRRRSTTSCRTSTCAARSCSVAPPSRS